MRVEELPFYNNYLKQAGKCQVCNGEITPPEYCVINTPGGVQVVHTKCLTRVTVSGCHAQIEVLYKGCNK